MLNVYVYCKLYNMYYIEFPYNVSTLPEIRRYILDHQNYT